LLTERLQILTAHADEKKRGTDEVSDKFDNVSKRLEAQMQELRRKESQHPESKKQIAALRAQCSLLEEENREMRTLLLRGGGAGKGKEGESLASYLKQLEQDPENAILQQVPSPSLSLYSLLSTDLLSATRS
jgi:23S rRNA pseudoU1915 N3-methylase RlmH